MFQFDLSSILGLVAVAMCWVLAVVLFRTGTRGSVARKLALLLAVEGFTLVTTGIVTNLIADEILDNWAFGPTYWQLAFFTHTLGDCAMLAIYPGFLAASLNTKLTRPFAGKRMQMFVYGVAVVLYFTALFTPFEIGGTLLYA